MSQHPTVSQPEAHSALSSEKEVIPSMSVTTLSTAPGPRSKSYSCALCRRRKIRCDKQSPCSKCLRANIACVFPAADRPPKWARRLDHLNDNASNARQDNNTGIGKVMAKLRNIERLVKELGNQREQILALAAASSVGAGIFGLNSQKLEVEDLRIQLPSSSGQLPMETSVDTFHEQWRNLVGISRDPRDTTQKAVFSSTGHAESSRFPCFLNQSTTRPISRHIPGNLCSHAAFEPSYREANVQQVAQTLGNFSTRELDLGSTKYASDELGIEQTAGLSKYPLAALPVDWSDGRTMGPGLIPWQFVDAAPSVDAMSDMDMNDTNNYMDLGGEANWYNWVESVKGSRMGCEA
jgi:hypothetical protein